MKKLLPVLLILISINTFAQNRFWKTPSQSRITPGKTASRISFPKEFKLFDLELPAMKNELFSVVNNAGRHTTIITLPNADGNFEQFEVVEASNFDAELQARFPQIRAFSGRGISDRYATLKLSISPEGIQTMVFRTDRENEFIEPYSSDHKTYAVFKSQRNAAMPWSCSTPDADLANGLNNQVSNSGLSGRSGGNLKTMRLAQSVTAEYSNYFGATSSSQVGLVLAAINATLTRCNGVYEKDLALHLNLISNTTSVIYYNASTDPYSAASSGAGGAWNNELQSTLTSVIGEANYDIGHLFGASGGGGNAGCIGCVCTNGSKGKGFTSPADGVPQGDNFDIDYVVHEVGHQLGANHTFSMSNEGTGVNKEPGSGITIMGYAGITSQDLAPHSIAAYHQASIAQIQANLLNKTCAVTTTISNATPVVAAVNNYTIPKSTPFALTGSGTDANAGDVLTYSWEQNDNASSSQTGVSSVASATKASGPNWISFMPTASPKRLFPKLATILSGGLVSGPLSGGDAGANTEALSSVARTLNFRLTVRDNAPYSSTAPVSVGQTQFTDMVVTVSSAAGPFAVTAPNTAVTWAGGSSQTITWSVNATNAAPVNCANVKISLSTDGGQTFPIVIASSTPNDGTETIVVPNNPSTQCRIMIEAVGNIFFDISNANFTITAAAGCGTATGLSASSITTSSANISWSSVSGAASYDVDYKASASSTWTNVATATTSTSAALSGLSSSTSYDWRVRANCSSSTGAYASSQFTTIAPATCGDPAGLTSTAITTSSANVSWNAVSGAVSYDVDYKASASATWINAATATSSTSVGLSGLSASTAYDWRVRANCASVSGNYSSSQFTTAAVPTCGTVTGLASSNIQSSSANISWSSLSSALNYDVDYKAASSGTWINVATATTSTSASLSSLTASTLYDWRVRANCNGATGSYSAAQFTTAAVQSSCVTAYEANETLATAAAISVNTPVSAAIGASGDIDYYKFTTASSGNLSVALSNLPGDYDLYLYNAAGTQIGSSTAGSTTNESISLSNQAAATYYIRVIGYNGANSTTVCYNLNAGFTAVTGCASSYDVSTNGTMSGAAVIPFNTNITGLINPAGDVDYYKFTITTGGTITITLGTLPGDYDVKLLNSAGTQVAISQAGGTTSESISYTAAAGTYYVQVYGYNNANSSTTCYTLKVQLGTAFKQADYVSDRSIRVFPNPADNKINFSIPGQTQGSAYRITDVNGKDLKKGITSGQISTADISSLAAGTYILLVQDAGKWSMTKFIKQ